MNENGENSKKEREPFSIEVPKLTGGEIVHLDDFRTPREAREHKERLDMFQRAQLPESERPVRRKYLRKFADFLVRHS